MAGNKQGPGRNSQWALWVQLRRRDARLTKRKLAEAAKVDPSYVILMERDGYVPSRVIVERVTKALGCSQDEGLLMAGYAPEHLTLEKYARITEGVLLDMLQPDMRKAVEEHLMPLKPGSRMRKQLLTFLSSCVAGTVVRRGRSGA